MWTIRLGYDELWKIIADPLTDLQNRGETVPTSIIKDLRSAKTLIQILKADPSHLEIIQEIETYLKKVEVYIFYKGQERLGRQYVDNFMRRLQKAREEIHKEQIPKTTSFSRFVVGAPRGKPWMRIKISDDISRESLESLAQESELSVKIQEDSYLLVYGEKDKIKHFVRKIANSFKRKHEE